MALAACSSDNTSTDAGTGTDTGTSTTTDGGTGDAGLPDLGPQPCRRDQNCEDGEVCNVLTGECGAGKTCTDNFECVDCGDPLKNETCGHGITALSSCEGGVCRRGLSNCEPCETDDECAPLPPDLGGFPSKCIEYASGGKFCGRSTRNNICPPGFVDNGEGFCEAAAGCPDNIGICPEKELGQNQGCFGTDQLCEGEVCPDTDGLRCTGNDLPGTVGVCFDFCTDNDDCPESLPFCNKSSGICTPGCTKDGCAAGQVCHFDGKCGAPCDSNANCEQRFNEDTYCNLPTQNTPPNYYKGSSNGYRDDNSCAPKGCERNFECGVSGIVCNPNQQPYPLCEQGCFLNDDCDSGFICKDPGGAPQQSYTRAECRALGGLDGSNTVLGVCCDPGCRDRTTQCPSSFDQRAGWWCCAEPDSPYADDSTCGTLEDPQTMQTRQAEAGECFLVEPPPSSPFCTYCDPTDAMAVCNSGWTPGFNTDPNYNNGQPYQEQEICGYIGDTANGPVGFCGITCNPAAEDNGCPRGWACTPNYPTCLQDADCNGLECIGEDTTVDPARPGRCKCGDSANGQFAQCPSMGYARFPGEVLNPRCVEFGLEMVCLATWNCVPPPAQVDMMTMQVTNYSDACLQQIP